MSAEASTRPRPLLVLVPGFWLGGWAWDAVTPHLEAAGASVRSVTLPGLEDAAAERGHLRLQDAVDAVTAVLEETGPAVLVGHSGAGSIVPAVTAAHPELVRRAVYVDAWPTPDGMAIMPDLPPDQGELPLPGDEELEADGNSLEGISAEGRAAFRARALPHPAGYARDAVRLAGPLTGVPTTLVLTSAPPEEVRAAVAAGHPFFAALRDLEVDYVHLPTGHWPMFSRPADLAAALLDAARRDPEG